MAKYTSPAVPRLTPEQRMAAAGQFERANQVLSTGNLDYVMELLVNCCLIDPSNPTYRQALRNAQKAKFGNSGKGQSLAFLTSLRAKLKVATALKKGEHLKVLEHGEEILARNPWDVGTHLAMAEAFDQLHLTGMAIWTLEQARQTDGDNPRVNRPLARLFEKTGNFTAATAMWELVRKADPDDLEAQHKYKDLAASATIAKGRYQDALKGTAPTPMASAATAENARPAALEYVEPAETAPFDGASPAALPSRPEARVPREVAALEAKIQTNPSNPQAYLHLAAVYRRADHFEQARQVLLGGLAPTANNFDIAMELVDLETEPFRRDLAVADERLRRQPDDAELQTLRARLAKEVATRELDYFRQKADRYPSEAAHRFEMGVRLFSCGQVDEAIRLLQGVRTDPRHQGKALFYLGLCFQSRDNWRLAQRNFEEALEHLGPADEAQRKEIYYQLARGYAASGDLTRAVDRACDLANLDFSYKDIGKLLDEWNAKLQKA